ncbi:MFS transporter [Lysinibacillus boronitolerans]|uniref:MFS transporter n=1 Tax=Lysinibacillus boronitolerans JCM 21713 = 10a = NBRC 103108 TaxID=1294264 RepID=A0ABR4Y3Z5_9BACI|nr:MFS transporter [Lysinibacillus boronitolerans]KGR88764.1 MFS transporter [Lysinibacillus boronitolerans JCM 21713 = 10a = NBRC 103108]
MTTTTAKNARYLVIAMLFLGWSLGNFDRFIINFAILDISKELQLTESLTGIVLSSFFAGYALMQIPGGWLADRFGYRKVLISTILVWSIFTVLTGAAWSFLSIIVIRFLFGVGEGSYFPAASKGIANWFPVDERSKAMSIMLTSGSIMGVVAPIVGTYLMLALGWRDIFYIVGAIGIVVALSFFFLVKEKNAPATEQVKAKTSKAPLREVLKTPMIWKLFIAYFSIYAVNWGLTSWMPTYLSKVKGLELTAVGIYSAIPPFIGIFAMLCSGYVLDKMPQGRDKLIAGIFAIIAGIGLLFMANAPSMLIFTICQSVVTVMLSFNIILITSVPLKILPEAVVGTANGFINTGAQFAGVLTPMLIGFLVEAFGGSYSAAFTMLIGFTIVCAVSLFLIRPNKNKVIVNSPSINEIID